MKKIFTVVLLATTSFASAQWSNTTNDFYDSLHMPACIAVQTQKNPIVVKSYPDSGYFLIWEDDRNFATTKTDIYAQKYDKDGNALWAIDGAPVVTGPNAQHYVFSSNRDYRSRSFAATDSAGGFFIGYSDDSISTYSWERIAVQHMLSNGSAVFPDAGFIIAQTPSTEGYSYSAPQLVADGGKGFFISFSRNAGGENYIYVLNYKEEGGTMTNYGGGRVNDNAIQRSRISQCGIQTYLEYPGTSVIDYSIWPDGQGGCNVIMSMNGNSADQYRMLAFNKIWRAKKDSRVKTLLRNSTGVACPRITEYKKGYVYPLYSLSKDAITTLCGGNGGPVYAVTSERLLSNGYQLIDQGGYDYNYPQGTTISTTGNINVDIMAVTKRTYTGVLSDFAVVGYGYREEIYDSVPFQRASFNNPEFGYNPFTPQQLNQLNNFRDTLLASGNYYPDFFLAGGGSEIYAAGLMSTSGPRLVRLQHLSVGRKSTDSFAIEYRTTNKSGEIIGKELSNISYDIPIVTVSSMGNALFYIREYYRSARVSPIINGAELAWGAMGRLVGTGRYNNSYYNFEQPYVCLDPLNGSGVIGWRDNRNIPGNTGENIFIRHLDSLNTLNYLPPDKPVKPLPNPYGGTVSNPAVLVGSSKQYSTIEAYGNYGIDPGTSTVAEILDNYNLGSVQVTVFQNRNTIRKYNNYPYLDRNYTINVESNPAAGVNINMRLFFTDEEFSALIAADSTITSPGDLVVIRQPNNTTTVPVAYTPVAGEEVITPIALSAVAGGYYLEIAAGGFGNFFIEKANTILGPISLSAQAQWQNPAEAKVSWLAATRQKVKDYTVQRSEDGNTYINVCKIIYPDNTNYNCTVPASSNVKNYYRVLQRDIAGKATYSNVVVLQSSTKSSLTVYPNPAKDKLYIDGFGGYRTVTIADVTGKIIQNRNLLPGLKYIDIGQLSQGVYLLIATNEKETKTMKFIKE